jgi:hypothetical protein
VCCERPSKQATFVVAFYNENSNNNRRRRRRKRKRK